MLLSSYSRTLTLDQNTLADRIRERAFHIWLEEGKPDGRDEAHWLEAEKELQGKPSLPEGEGKNLTPSGPIGEVALAPGQSIERNGGGRRPRQT